MKHPKDEANKHFRVSNDMTKKDPESEKKHLHWKSFQKNENKTENWKYTIRGPPEERPTKKNSENIV